MDDQKSKDLDHLEKPLINETPTANKPLENIEAASPQRVPFISVRENLSRPYDLLQQLEAQLTCKGDRVVRAEFYEKRTISPSQSATNLGQFCATVDEHTLENVEDELHELIEHIQDDCTSQEWTDGVGEYFGKVGEFVRNQDEYDHLKTTCFIYRLIKFEENLNWIKIDNTDNSDIIAARCVWRNSWRQRTASLSSPLILTTLLIRAHENLPFFINGSSLDEYSLYVDNAVECLEGAAKHINKTTTRTGVAKLAAGGTGLVAGALGITGVVLAPPTGGLSLGLTIGGMTAGIAAGSTSLASTIIKNKTLAKTITESRIAMSKALKYSLILKELVNDLNNTLAMVQQLLNQVDAADFKAKLDKCKNKAAIMEYTVGTAGIGWEIFNGITSIGEFNVAVSLLKGLNAGIFQPIAKVSGTAAKAIPTGISKFSDTLTVAFQAGSIGSRVLGSVAVAITLFTSVNDIIDGKKDVGENELATDLTELASTMAPIRDSLIEAIERFQLMELELD